MSTLTTEETKWVLSLPMEYKLQLMEDMLKEKKMDEWFSFIKILLDAPISEGGVETDIIDKIFNKHKDGKI